MDALILFIIYLCMFLIVYNYFIYPLCIITASKLIKNKHHASLLNDNDKPSISFIIAAYNEEKVIRKKIENTLEIDYPKSKIEFIVVSDGSEDSTPDICKEFPDIISMHEKARKGKSAALNRAVKESNHEIIVFSDANNDFSSDSLNHLVKHFIDPNIDAVTGAKHIYSNSNRQAAEGDGLYWKYESKIKQAESDLGSITAAEGEILAVRKASYNPIDETLINDDAAITFDIVKSGKRILYEKNAKAFEEASLDLVDDFNVKVRMTSGGYQTVIREINFLFPPRTWFAFTYISHKLLRWLAPHFMITILILTLMQLNKVEMQVLLVLQIIFYALSLYGWIKRATKLPWYIYIPMYFSSMNYALFIGFLRFMNKKQNIQWKKAER